ncbi:unnamed protein product [Calypogeia fissa]
MAETEPLVLKANCNGCGTTNDLYGSNCRHMTLCVPCGKSLVETSGTCTECNAPVTRLIREYNVKHHAVNKNYFVGRFHQGVPHYSKKKNSEARWRMQREGLQGRQLTDALREKYKNKPWLLEDDIGKQQFTGQLEGGQQATYFLLIMQGSDFLALPAGNWYNFHKVAHYKQLTLEEAEEQMKNRRKTADGYQRWMMKAANTGAAAFGVGDSEQIGGIGGSGGRAKRDDEDGNADDSDKAEEDEDEEEARKNRLGMDKPGGDEEGEEPALDLDLDDDEGEKGDDWEHEETFTDDDEAVGNDADEREDQVNPEVPPPPEIKQEEEDEEEDQENPQEEPGGLSKSGKELKKLLGKAAKEDDSDGGDGTDDGTDEDVDLDNEDIGMSPVLAPTRKEGPKEEPTDGTPAKAAPVAKSTPPSTAAGKTKRKASATEESKTNGAAAVKKAKTETAKATPPSATLKKDVNAAVNAAIKTTPTNGKATAKQTPAPNQAVTEAEVMRVLQQTGPIKSTDLVAKFRSRLKTAEDKAAFAAILKKISRIQKTDGANYIVLRTQQ